MIDKCPPWYSDTEIKPRYENDDVCLLWDIPEFTGRDGEDVNDTEVLRPDGRLMLKKEKIMYVLEMSVPWIQNRETKFKDKEDKYKDLLINMRGLYKDYKIEQVTFIIDVLGGYSQSFIDSLKKLKFTDVERSSILRNAQKIVLSESRCIVNRFKLRTASD